MGCVERLVTVLLIVHYFLNTQQRIILGRTECLAWQHCGNSSLKHTFQIILGCMKCRPGMESQGMLGLAAQGYRFLKH